MAGHHHAAPEERAGTHIVSVKTYLAVITALMVLLVVTLVAAAFDLGALNLPIAMLIAIVKVYLIMTYFMHLKFNTKLVRLFALGAFAFLFLMFLFTFSDYLSRDWFKVQ